MSEVTIQSLLETLCPGVEWQEMPIVMPLVTGLSVISPDDVTGFGVINPKSKERRIIIIKNRDWAGNSQFTGITADMYNANAVDEQDAIHAMKELLRGWGTCLSYSERLTGCCLTALTLNASVIPIGNAARFAELGRVPIGLQQTFKENGQVPFYEVAKAISNTVMPRIISRLDLERRLKIYYPDNRPELPVVDRTLLRDAEIWLTCLGMPAVSDIA